MTDAVRNKPETAPSDTDLEALYEDVFGTPALEAMKEGEPDPMDESDDFARVYEVAKRRPWVALRAAYEGVAAHFRDEGPFDYSVDEARSGEVAQ
jgi:hypothetical protein